MTEKGEMMLVSTSHNTITYTRILPGDGRRSMETNVSTLGMFSDLIKFKQVRHVVRKLFGKGIRSDNGVVFYRALLEVRALLYAFRIMKKLLPL